MTWQFFALEGVQIGIAFTIGVAVLVLIAFTCRRLLKTVSEEEEQHAGDLARLLGVGCLIALGVTVALAIGLFIASRLGVDTSSVLRAVANWLLEHGIKIGLVVLVSYIAYKLVRLTLPHFLYGLVKVRGGRQPEKEEVARRSAVLGRFLTNVTAAVIAVLALFMVLSEVGLDIAPLLAGAGVIGIAVGLGSQKIIGDVINGLFVVLEDHYSIGDVVKVAGVTGLVEDVNIRRTVLRDLDGVVHIVPNSEIKVASNYTRDWSRVNMNVPVAYGEDLDRVIGILNEIGHELACDEEFGPMIINAPQVLRVDKFGDSAIELKILGETRPIKQWDVMGELRKRIKKTFDREGIEIPWPHTKIYFGDGLEIRRSAATRKKE